MEPEMRPTLLAKCGLLLAMLGVSAACATPRVSSLKSPDGIDIVYEVRGKGAPLVFVHGWSCDRSYWRGQVELFARDHRVITIDLAGHGASGLGRKAWTIESYGADVAAVVTKLDLQRAVLIGHSMGGDVILEAARRLRGRIAGLVWVDAYQTLGKEHTATLTQVARFLQPFEYDFAAAMRAFVRGKFPAGADPALLEWVSADMAAAPREVALAEVRSALAYNDQVPAALQELRLPLVAINPEAPPTNLDEMTRSGIEVLFVSGAGHFLMLEKPGPFNQRLAEALTKIASSSRR
jgi:pimeloyl-ACP methyl ester carboxylesterase